MNDEHTILNHYNLNSAFPIVWPEEKDESDESEGENSVKYSKDGLRRSKSRYSALERSGSDGRRSLVPGSQKLRDGQEALVQKDEADPLGVSDSVVRVLEHKGLSVDQDPRLRELLYAIESQRGLKMVREQISPFVNHLFTESLSLSSTCWCLHG